MRAITKKVKAEFVKKMLSTNESWALRCLEVIYDRQTYAERCVQRTITQNGVGFSGADSEILTSFYQQYKRAGGLSERQMCVLQRRAPRYWSQILSIIPEQKLIQSMLANGAITQDQYDMYEKQLFLENI